MDDLTDIRGIASRTASKLTTQGIETPEQLAEADPDKIDELGDSKAEKLVRRAQQATITSQTAADLLDDFTDQRYISTGIPELDTVLGGGWEPGTVGLVYGKSGTAKTQVLFSSMSQAAAEGSVVYLMTEVQSKSIADRMRSLADNVDHLENIHIYEAYDVNEQYETYHVIEEEFDDIDLFVIDSFTAQFRTEEKFDGRNNLGDRSTEMGRHLREIGEMARVFDTPVVMAGQVYPTPEAYGQQDNPYGGEKMYHFVSYFLRMSNGQGNLKEAALENHPGIEESGITLRIEDDSIEGVIDE